MTSANSHYFWARQLQLAEQKPTAAENEQTVSAILDKAPQDVRFIYQLQQDALENSPLNYWAKPLSQLHLTDKNRRIQLISQLLNRHQKLNKHANQVNLDLRQRLAYLVQVLIITALCAAIYTTKVIPELASLYALNEMALPQISQFAHQYANPISLLITLILVGMVGASHLFSKAYQRACEQLSPIQLTLPHKAFYEFKHHFNYLIFLCYQPHQPLLDNLAEDVVNNAKQQYPEYSEQLRIAEQLGNLTVENNHQFDEQLSELFQTVNQRLDLLQQSLSIAIYCYIGFLLIAFYLPIFQMGSVVS